MTCWGGAARVTGQLLWILLQLPTRSHYGLFSPHDSIPAPTHILPLNRLFQMNLGPPKTLEELDPESREYWRLLRKQNIWRNNRLSKGQKF